MTKQQISRSDSASIETHYWYIIDCDTRPGQLIFMKEQQPSRSVSASVETHYRYIINCDTRPGQLTFHEGTAAKCGSRGGGGDRGSGRPLENHKLYGFL